VIDKEKQRCEDANWSTHLYHLEALHFNAASSANEVTAVE